MKIVFNLLTTLCITQAAQASVIPSIVCKSESGSASIIVDKSKCQAGKLELAPNCVATITVEDAVVSDLAVVVLKEILPDTDTLYLMIIDDKTGGDVAFSGMFSAENNQFAGEFHMAYNNLNFDGPMNCKDVDQHP